jgi:hypothetical protein
MATVKIKLGDMFGGPADLIVLPCSTGGTISTFVARRLATFQIAPPKPGMKLGSVELRAFQEGENIAQFVGFATSVNQNWSSLDAISHIGESLGEATVTHQAIRAISCPLFGAGAGNLGSENVVRALTRGFKSRADDSAVLTIFVLHQVVFDRLAQDQGFTVEQQTIAGGPPLRVFMSYSHTSSAHEAWVKGLATFLRGNGVDARIDIWHLSKGMELAQFMTNELVLADRVIIVSDDLYVAKADGRVGGVGWETMIMQSDPSFLDPESKKFYVIARSMDYSSGVPRHLVAKYGTHWPPSAEDEPKRQDLLRDLFDAVAAPPLGPRPVFV